ncbi:hypothetical protein [Bradyrhizobium sp. ORS 86]|uniref:hypothetical protein n=1 Tax=Bradyrhizobium sp. ORS 86 TaxID=1685970 RepID=UPI00388EC645
MSAKIIQFIPRPRREREQTDFPTIAFCSMALDLDKDRADRLPSEYLPSDWQEK